MIKHEAYIKRTITTQPKGGGGVVPCRELLKYGKRQISVVDPVLEDQGAAIHRDFW